MDLIFHGGRVVTVDDLKQARAVAVQGDIIRAVGDTDQIMALKDSKTVVIDLQGRSLVPGFNDSHMHLLGYALTAEKVDLRHCASVEQVVSAFAAFIDRNKLEKGTWVLGWGWDQSLFDQPRLPDRFDLDRASTDHFIAAARTCCHLLSVNSAVLNMAGLERRPASVEGGKVQVDAAGIPTGVLEESAMELVTAHYPPLDEQKIKSLVMKAGADFLAAGLTSVQTDDLYHLGGEKVSLLVEIYRELEAGGKLPLRINLQALLPRVELLEAFLDSGYRSGQGSPSFRIGPLKLLTDGSIGGRTALLSEPYADDPGNCGVAVLGRDETEELVNLASANRMQVAAHAIGDAAVSMVLDIFEKAAAGWPRPDPRFRVIHASMVSADILDRFQKQEIIADIQPSFTPSDYLLVDRHLGPRRAAWTYCWKEFVRKGIRMGGGSDCPVENYAPLEGIHAAVTREDKMGNPPGGWYPGQRLDLSEALRLYTMGSAFCTYEENLKGSITAGKLADLVVLSEDITVVEPSQIKDVRVDMTIVGGKIAYVRPGN